MLYAVGSDERQGRADEHLENLCSKLKGVETDILLFGTGGLPVSLRNIGKYYK